MITNKKRMLVVAAVLAVSIICGILCIQMATGEPSSVGAKVLEELRSRYSGDYGANRVAIHRQKSADVVFRRDDDAIALRMITTGPQPKIPRDARRVRVITAIENWPKGRGVEEGIVTEVVISHNEWTLSYVVGPGVGRDIVSNDIKRVIHHISDPNSEEWDEEREPILQGLKTFGLGEQAALKVIRYEGLALLYTPSETLLQSIAVGTADELGGISEASRAARLALLLEARRIACIGRVDTATIGGGMLVLVSSARAYERGCRYYVCDESGWLTARGTYVRAPGAEGDIKADMSTIIACLGLEQADRETKRSKAGKQ